MSRQPRTVARECLAREALQSMERNPGGPITQLVVVDDGRPVGVVHIHDILHRRVAGEWRTEISDYQKLRLDSRRIDRRLENNGLEIVDRSLADGMIVVVARRSE